MTSSSFEPVAGPDARALILGTRTSAVARRDVVRENTREMAGGVAESCSVTRALTHARRTNGEPSLWPFVRRGARPLQQLPSQRRSDVPRGVTGSSARVVLPEGCDAARWFLRTELRNRGSPSEDMACEAALRARRRRQRT
jgi:hypothetical protein